MKKKTLFVRNIPPDVTEEELQTLFSEYGKVHFFKLTKDKNTGAPRGNGFVKYQNSEDAQVCLEMAYLSRTVDLDTSKKNIDQAESDIVVKGKHLIINWAERPDKVQEIILTRSGKKQKKEDPRHLRLAYIGGLNPNSEEVQDLPPAQRAKVISSWKDKKLKLASPNFHVSDVRLSIRNLPKSINEKALREVFRRAARKNLPPSVNPAIRQVKIVMENSNVPANEKGKSRGFGFVEFVDHRAAMNALNNSNNIAGIIPKYPNIKITVEFAVDNVQKLNIRKDRLKRDLQRKESDSSMPEPKKPKFYENSHKVNRTPQQNKRKRTESMTKKFKKKKQ